VEDLCGRLRRGHFFGLAAGSIAGGQRFVARGKRFDEKINNLLCAAAIGSLSGLYADIEAADSYASPKSMKEARSRPKRQSAAAGRSPREIIRAMTSTSREETLHAGRRHLRPASCAAFACALD